jgi:hypothetical protein
VVGWWRLYCPMDAVALIGSTCPYARKPNFCERARRLREIVAIAQTGLSDRLRMMSEELEMRADELEQAYPSSNDGS